MMMKAERGHNNTRPISPRHSASVADALHIFESSGSDQMPCLSQQYALPIHNGTSYNNRKGNGDGEDGGSEQGENTLRRKTPNGTLNAGYDAASETVNPNKHLLMPAQSGQSIGLYNTRSQAGDRRTFSQRQQSRTMSSWTNNTQCNLGWPNGFLPQSQMDSMLHQMPIQHYHTQQYYGQTVPSVLQPSFQQLGPTASGVQGSGPYGPYWHDGTYVPYRPAAVRDPRFYINHGTGWNGSLASGQLAQQAANWQARLPLWSGGGNKSVNTLYVNNGSVSPYAGTSASPHTLPSHGETLHPELRFTQAGLVTPVLKPTGSARDSVASEFGPSSLNGQQRDKTFAWALQQYRDLLGFIHHTRRQHQQHRQLYGQQQIQQRPSFFPKPPRASPAGSLPPAIRRTASLGSKSGDEDSSVQDIKRDDAGSAPNFFQGNFGTDATNLRASSVRSPFGVQFNDSDYQHRASYHQGQQVQSQFPAPLPSMSNRFRTLRRSSGSSISPMISPLAPDDSLPSRAVTALKYITKLCQDSEWQWTDGMHLGGCLAYGLGDYQKAMRWYTKVLEMDPRHLEATSNLAATLLALGRRQEAEQYWMKVVKAAPNHFEAVEHLVGLLCNDQRSRDAVRVIEDVERSLRQQKQDQPKVYDRQSECSSSTASRSPCVSELSDQMCYDFEADGDNIFPDVRDAAGSTDPGFGSSGFSIPGCDNGRMLALIHAKGNMLYVLGDNAGAAKAFEDAVMIAAGRRFSNIHALVNHILTVVISANHNHPHIRVSNIPTAVPILLSPQQALETAKLCFPIDGQLPGLQHVAGGPTSLARKAAISTTSNSLLSLAKIFQDSMSNNTRTAGVTPLACGVRDILALYYLSLSLQPSPSTANNVGILLASVQQAAPSPAQPHQKLEIPGVVPGSGIALALQYYNYGLQLDQRHAHLFTNLGSLLKDIGQLDAAIQMYERAVSCDDKFDIALANLANAVKDKGRISDAIVYYKRAVDVSPEFAEAVCGLANALNSVCGWAGRGGIATDGGGRDRWHVDNEGMLLDARAPGASSSGWIKRVVDIVEKQLVDGESWGRGTLSSSLVEDMVQQMTILDGPKDDAVERKSKLRNALTSWTGKAWEGARVTRLVERATKHIGWRWYRDKYTHDNQRAASSYARPQLPASLAVPPAPTVLPFHTFTCPMSAKQIRLISQRTGLRISVSTLRAPWLPKHVYPPPSPPSPHLRVGYVSSDFNNHPLAHLMQSVFGLHNAKRVKAYCYATTASDKSVHRQQIESEAPVFHDASSWSAEKVVNQIVNDGIHILVNLNGYTRGARNEVFAARPAPIQMSFMGFAGTLGAEWCDYLLADETAIPPETLRPWRRNVNLADQMMDDNNGSEQDHWVYGENIIYCRDTFFCCDHRQSAPDAHDKRLSWDEEQTRRWQMRKELFPTLPDETIIFGNFNQLYKIEPTTFRSWLRIIARVPNSVLWLLRFPDLGESHLLATARLWAGNDVASRVLFTDVAPKHVHISRARVCDLVLDTPECNAHTTAADVLWSGTPLLTLPRYGYKMCSRMAASILKGALPKDDDGKQAVTELIVKSEEAYEEAAVGLGKGLSYRDGCEGKGTGRLLELRKTLYHARWSSALFDTSRWVADLEDAYEKAWEHWLNGEGGDIWLD